MSISPVAVLFDFSREVVGEVVRQKKSELMPLSTAEYDGGSSSSRFDSLLNVACLPLTVWSPGKPSQTIIGTI